MSNERHNPEPFRDASDTVPDDLYTLHQRLIADGSAWRRNLPSPDTLIQRTQAEFRARSDAAWPPDRFRGTRSTQATSPRKGAAIMPKGHLRGVMAGFSAVAIVALFVLVFHGVIPGHTGRTHSTVVKSGTVASGPPAITSGKWVLRSEIDIAQESNGTPPAIAPSDTRVIYNFTADPLRLQRTANDGQTWQTLSLPMDASKVSQAAVFVSPLSARTVFITLESQTSIAADPNCPNAGFGQTLLHGGNLMQLSGMIPCTYQYFSTDSGQHWQTVHLPASGVLTPVFDMLYASEGTVLKAQGSRLYAGLGCGLSCRAPSSRLVVSDDGGVTWNFADTALQSGGYALCDAAPAPTGNQVYALTAASRCDNEVQSPLTLWRSDDAGAHWNEAGTLPSALAVGLTVVNGSNPLQPLLYISLPPVKTSSHVVTTSSFPTNLKLSTDGGRTWQSAPAQGWPTTRQSPVPLGVLSDGSIVAESQTYTTGSSATTSETATVYAWKLGESAWHQVTAPLQGGFSFLLVAPAPTPGHDEFWALQLQQSSKGSVTPANLQEYES